MAARYSVALWNYRHYTNVPSLERIIARLREQDYGIELWPSFGDEKNLLDEVGRKRVRNALEGMTCSLHATNEDTFDGHRKQIEAAADFGAEVIVMHSQAFLARDRADFEVQQRGRGESSLDVQLARKPSDFDVQLARKTVAYAAEHGIRIALENGIDTPPFPMLVNAIEQVEGLCICLDTGHLYRPWDRDPAPDPMRKFLDALKGRLLHLHLDDSDPETIGDDHLPLGVGKIPDKDWELLAMTLEEIDFQGMAVFEITPMSPLQIADLGRAFLQGKGF